MILFVYLGFISAVLDNDWLTVWWLACTMMAYILNYLLSA